MADKWFYGPWTGGGTTTRFRTVLGLRTTSQTETGATVQWRLYIETKGDWNNSAHVSGSWYSGTQALDNPGYYRDTGWRNLKTVTYGATVTASAWSRYTGYSGALYNSPVSGSTKPDVPTWAPKAPTNPKASLSSGKAVVTWTANPSTPRPWTSVRVWRSVNGGRFGVIAELSGSSTRWTDETLGPNAVYAYQVESRNSAGSGWSASTNSVSTLPGTPAAPTGLSVTRASDLQNDVAWTNNPTADAGYASVVVERSVNGGAWSRLATLSATASTYTDKDCGSDRWYRYRVAGSNASGLSPWAESAPTYNTPSAPSAVTGARAGAMTVQLSIDNPSVTASATQIQRSSDGASWADVAVTDGKATAYTDSPGEGSFWYRARNTRGALASAWTAAESPVLTVCPPLAPTLTAPAMGSVVPTDRASVTFSWVHNPPDGSRQTAAQLQWSANGGAWTTVDVAGAAQSATVANSFPVNASVAWRVRTKGSHAEFGPWSGNGTFAAKQPPSGWFVSPAEVVEALPIAVRVGYADASGQLAALRLTVTDVTDGGAAVVYERDMGRSTTATVTKDEFTPVDGRSYVFSAAASSTSGLQCTFTSSVLVAYVLPMQVSLRVDADLERGHVSLTPYVNRASGGAPVVSMSVWRVVDGRERLIGSDLADGQEVIDRHAPLNKKFSYRAVSYAESGAACATEHEGSVKTPYLFLYFGEGRIARAMYDPAESLQLERTGRQEVRYAGREFAVLYDSGGEADRRTVSAVVEGDGEAAEFRALAKADRCVYKSMRGDVIWCAPKVTLTPDLRRPGHWWEVSLELERIDGEEL